MKERHIWQILEQVFRHAAGPETHLLLRVCTACGRVERNQSADGWAKTELDFQGDGSCAAPAPPPAPISPLFSPVLPPIGE